MAMALSVLIVVQVLVIVNFVAADQQKACSADVIDACLYKGKLSKHTQLRNITCRTTKSDCANECCSACAAQQGCNSWTVWPHGITAKCFLTTWNEVYGPGSKDCASGIMIGPAPAPPVPPPKNAKNVLLLIVDDMRPQLNAAYGQTFMITPNLDKLAKSPGTVVFDRAYVQVAWCSPSRNSFLTSRYPDTLQIWNFGKSFRDTPENPPDNSTRPDMKVVPLPQWFKHNGYLSLGGGKVYHPNQPFNNDVPYSWSDGPIPYFNFSDPDCPNSPGNNKVGCQGCPEDAPDEKFYDWKLANHTIHALRAAKNDAQGRPFFIAAGFRRPHTPWHIAQRFVDMYPTNLSDIPAAKHPSWAHGAPPCAFICGGDGVGCDFDIDHPRNSSWSSLCRRTYYAAVTATDHYIGLVLDELDALGLTNSTAVAVFGDHGWHLGEGDQWAKYTTFEIATRTPLILRAPWISSPNATPDTVTHARTFVDMVDIYPTLADLAGIPHPPHAEGLSLVPALTHPSTTSLRTSSSSQFAHCCYGHHPLTPNHTSLCGMCGHSPSADISYMGYAVRDQDFRFVEWYRWLGEELLPDCAGVMAMELYPHEGDTGRGEQAFDSDFETRNLVANQSMAWGVGVGASDGPYSNIIKRMHAELLKKFPKSLGRCVNKTEHVVE